VPAWDVNEGVVGDRVLLGLTDLLLRHFGLYTIATIHAMNECNDMRKDMLKYNLTKLVS
jgi:hypothetical protein